MSCVVCAALGSPFSLLECSPKQSSYLLVILATGALKVWHVGKRKLVLSESIEAITNVVDLSDARRLTLLRCHITVKGQPILTFAKATADSKAASSLISYTFDLSMDCWYVGCDNGLCVVDYWLLNRGRLLWF